MNQYTHIILTTQDAGRISQFYGDSDLYTPQCVSRLIRDNLLYLPWREYRICAEDLFRSTGDLKFNPPTEKPESKYKFIVDDSKGQIVILEYDKGIYAGCIFQWLNRMREDGEAEYFPVVNEQGHLTYLTTSDIEELIQEAKQDWDEAHDKGLDDEDLLSVLRRSQQHWEKELDRHV